MTSPSALYILCDARSECVRMAATFVRSRNWKNRVTSYVRARHGTIGDILLSIATTTVKKDDDVLIAVPRIDDCQRETVINALKIFHDRKINYFWCYAPEWFDASQTVVSAVTEAKKDKTPDSTSSSSSMTTVNICYSNETESARSETATNLIAYIDYRLMYLFMGVDSEESTLKAIISALADKDEAKFQIPNEAPKMLELVKQFTDIRPSMAGRSRSFENYKKRIVDLARLDKNVLIVGETGTGKEATAYFLHEFSPRRGKKFIPVNCACYTEDLLMSELFGHSKGSFSGATAEKKGLVEDADGGTMFLDEIPDASPRVQAMLLRFLQSGEYSRVGSNKTEKVDVKIVAGAQPGLLDRLRDDLQYRIGEKIHTFSLRELNSIYRKQPDNGLPDIISMARNLAAGSIGTRKVAHNTVLTGFNYTPSRITHGDIVRFWKEIEQPVTIDLFTRYEWPGNVRELQTCISRHLCENIPLDEAVAQLKKESATGRKLCESAAVAENALLPHHLPQSEVSTKNSSGIVSFARIEKPDELIPFHEIHNLYAQFIRDNQQSGILKHCTHKEIQEILGLSTNTYRKYILVEEEKKKQRKEPKAASISSAITAAITTDSADPGIDAVAKSSKSKTISR